MPDIYGQELGFVVDGRPADTFAVFRLTGREAISELFRFEIDLVSDDPGLVLESLVGAMATLTVTRLEQSRRIHGMVARLALHDVTPHGHHVYRAVLVPRLYRLALTRQNQIHGTSAPVTVREVIADELSAASLKGDAAAAVAGRLGLGDFEFRLMQTYPARDYVVQYDESDFAFVSRLCEHYGIFYFFTHDSGRDLVVFGDCHVAFPTANGSSRIPYRSASGLTNADEAAIFRFAGQAELVPEKVCLRDYNYRIPNLTLEVDETVDPDGHGVVVDYGSHFRTPEEGRELARVRAEELASRKLVFEGASDSVHLTAGTVFELADHFWNAFNAGYLVTWVEHEATQPLPGIAEFAGADLQNSYRNRFECLPKDVEFRPQRRTPKPRMAGLSNAVVDASGSGLRAEVDSTGRYKVRQQFDQRGETAGQASRYMRKAEPYGGANTGLHFPLLKGTEVVLACVNGDPDRPIIVGALQNEQYPSVVNARNSTRNRMRTTGGTLFEIDDGPAPGAGGGSGAGSGTALAPQRALEGAGADVAAATRSLSAQRAEADIQTSGNSSSSYARLHVTAGTEAYWRLGSEPSNDSAEDSLTPDMSDMTGGGDAGSDGLFEYSAGDRTSLVDGSCYRQTDGNTLDYVKGRRRMSAATHNTVSKGQYQVIANGISLEASTATITDNSAPAAAPAGDLVITTAGNLTETVGASASTTTHGDAFTWTNGTETKLTGGSAFDFFFGSSVKLYVGSSIGIYVISKTDVWLGLKIDLGLGILDFKLRVCPVVEYFTISKTSLVGMAKIKAHITEVKTAAAAKVDTAMSRLGNAISAIDTETLAAGSRQMAAYMGFSAHI